MIPPTMINGFFIISQIVVSDETAFCANWLVRANSSWFHILLDSGVSLSGMVVYMKEPIYDYIYSFQEKNINIYFTILCQYKRWKYCFQA